jgi:hypothetical protein
MEKEDKPQKEGKRWNGGWEEPWKEGERAVGERAAGMWKRAVPSRMNAARKRIREAVEYEKASCKRTVEGGNEPWQNEQGEQSRDVEKSHKGERSRGFGWRKMNEAEEPWVGIGGR